MSARVAAPDGALEIAFDGPLRIEATDDRHHRCSLVLTAPDGFPTGAELRILAGPFRAVLDSECHDQIHFNGIEAGVPLEIKRRPPATIDEIFDAFVLPRISVLELGLPHGCPPGATVRVELGVRPSPHAGIDLALDVEARPAPDRDFTPTGARVLVPVVAGPAAALECRARRNGDGATVSVFARDAFANVAESYDGRVELTGAAPGLPRTVDVIHGHAVVELGDVPLERPLRIEAHDRERGWTAVAPPLAQEMPYFGELHFHTSFSGDGGGSIEAAYAYARDVLQLDLIAVTDHTPVEHWEETKRLGDAFDEPQRFVVLPAWEWSTRHGHANVYLRTPEVDAGPERASEADHPSRLTWPPNTLLIPHHTNIDSTYDEPDNEQLEPHWFEYDWSTRNPAIRLVEIAQCRGNFEADERNADWGIVTGGIGASVQDALEQGYRIGFVGGTDNHSGAPTRDSLKPGTYAGLTGIYTDALTRTDIWDALWARRTYATSGVPIVGRVRIAGVDMGASVDAHEGPVRLEADLHGTAPIERVEVIGDRRVVWSMTPQALDVSLSDVLLPDAGWYYLRLRQEDGHRAWFSPVWIDRG